MEHRERRKEEGGRPSFLSVDFKAGYCHMPLGDQVYKKSKDLQAPDLCHLLAWEGLFTRNLINLDKGQLLSH